MSNRTLKNHAAKTALAPKAKVPKLLAVSFFVFVVTLIAWSVLPIYSSNSDCRQLYNVGGKLRLSRAIFNIDHARTATERERGLSGTKCINNQTVKLFVFAQSGPYCFWMKDINYPIDIVWLDQSKKIVTIKTDVSPRSYPDTFCPDFPSRYVMEFKAGTAKRLGLTTKDTAVF